MMKTGSFSFRLFASVGGVLLAMAACFAIFQDHRERAYKIDVLQGRLQTYNFELLQTLGDSVASPRCFDCLRPEATPSKACAPRSSKKAAASWPTAAKAT